MMKKAIIVLFMAILALSFCSQGKESPQPQIPVHEKNEPAPPSRAAEADAASPLRIVSLALSPETPTVSDDIVASAELSDPGLKNVTLRYKWFVNGQEVPAADGEKLDKSNFRKGAWIHCQARAESEAGAGEWFKSAEIRVLNSLPAMQIGPIASFAIPGEFQYQAAASDPDDDELTFELLSPLDQGIALDAKTGALSWNLDNDAVKRLGESVEIKLAVSDGEGEKVEGTITLHFTTTKK